MHPTFAPLWAALATRETPQRPPPAPSTLADRNPFPHEGDIVFNEEGHRYAICDGNGLWLGKGLTSVSKLATPILGDFPGHLAAMTAGVQVWLQEHYEKTIRTAFPYCVFRDYWDLSFDGPPEPGKKRRRRPLPEASRSLKPSLKEAAGEYPKNAAGKSKRKLALRECDVFRFPIQVSHLAAEERAQKVQEWITALQDEDRIELMDRIYGHERGCKTAKAIQFLWQWGSTRFGTYIHEQIERLMNELPIERDNSRLRSFCPRDDDGQVDEEDFQRMVRNYETCMGQYFDFCAQFPLEACRSEFRVCDPGYCVTGTIDALYVAERDADGKVTKVIIGDWKTSKNVWNIGGTSKGFCKPPFAHWPKTDIQKFTIQVNLYRHLIELRYGVEVVGMFVCVFNANYSTFQRIEIPREDMLPLLDAHGEWMRPEVEKLVQDEETWRRGKRPRSTTLTVDDELEAAIEAAEQKWMAARASAVLQDEVPQAEEQQWPRTATVADWIPGEWPPVAALADEPPLALLAPEALVFDAPGPWNSIVGQERAPTADELLDQILGS